MPESDRFPTALEAASPTTSNETGNSALHTENRINLPGTNILMDTIENLLDAETTAG